MAEKPGPVPVVDEDDVLRGVIVRGALLAGLAECVAPSAGASGTPTEAVSVQDPGDDKGEGS